MLRRAMMTVGTILLATFPAFADDPPPTPAPKAADGDAPLPEGWPGATAPGTIEVKRYPAYRSAVARAKDVKAMQADNVLFFTLFGHIESRGIAMTAPVVSGFEGKMADDPKATGDATMEFLYRRPDQGTAGPGLGRVTVEDHPAASYLCLGLQGDLTPDRLREALPKLRDWLAAHRDEWVEDGPPRWLGYHGPSTPRAQRLYEVQIPVKPATRSTAKAE